jgi:beta-glucosidase
MRLLQTSNFLSIALVFQPIAGLDFSSPSAWEAATLAAADFVSQLNTTEKIGLVTGGYASPQLPCVGSIGGIPRLNFSGICFYDGPTGLARQDGVSVFPAGLTTAATWDRRLMYERGVALGEEFRGKGSHVHLGYVSCPTASQQPTHDD